MTLLQRLINHIKQLSLSVLLVVSCSTFAETFSEQQIKAAYLYNFAKFAEWPATALPGDLVLNLCVIGNGETNNAITALQGRAIGERQLRVAHFSYGDTGLEHCQLLFIAQSEQQHFLVILKTLGDAPVLTLSDIPDFAEKGGAIGLSLKDEKIVFEVNLDTVRAARLYLPGQLLNIARHVYGK